MSRCGRRAVRRGGGGRSLSQQFAALFQGSGTARDVWLDSTSYTVDGGSGKVLSFVDRADPTHIVTNATTAQQVAVPATAANWTGNVATFVAGSATRYVSNRAGSSFKFCQDGTGMTAVLTCRVTSNANVRMVSTGAAAPTFQMYATTSADAGVVMYNDTSAMFNYNPAVVWTLPQYLHFSYSEAANPDGVLRVKTVTTNSGDRNFAPSVADPSGTLTLGSDFGGTLPCSMEWANLFLFHRVLSATEIATMRSYIALATGVV